MTRRASTWTFNPGAFTQLRERSGLSMTELARQARTYPSTISSWERGVKAPSMSRLAAVIAALGADISDVVTFPDEDALTLRELRESRLFSREDVASALGVAIDTIGPIERGIIPLTPERVSIMADLYEVSPEVVRNAQMNTIYRSEKP